MIVGWLATVVAALGWSALDVTRKSLVGRMDPVVLLLFLGLGQVPLHLGIAAWEGHLVDDLAAYLPVGSWDLAVNVAANYLYLRSVKGSDLSLVIPLLSLVPVFTVAAAYPLLGEWPSDPQLVGIALVAAGALGLNAAAAGSWRPWALLLALARERGARLMVAVAGCWAVAIALDKIALRHASAGAHAAFLNGGIALAAGLALAWRRRWADVRRIRQAPGTMIVAVIAAAVAMVAQLVAIGALLAGVVEAGKRAIGMTSALVFGRVAFDEPWTATRGVAVLLMAFGTALVVLG